ncbi:hypothetical protein MSAN_00737500 [Mycena sanguinolenta]|uniref:Uncharacterized protein n=1 Tax=Mycena sanguinolenta TaxID=230812 RepID=A0A8H6Z2G5_9AGAR|nr:hypothetical protein MSAN_00737500 [Mycena sanguinolenta]
MVVYLAAKMDVQLGGKRLYVIIDNYESSRDKFSGELPKFYLELQCTVWTESIAGVVYTAYMDESALYHYAADADHNPDSPVDPLPFDAPPALDLTHHPILQSAIGFTAQDIPDLDAATQDIARPGARPLLELVEREWRARAVRFSRSWTDKMHRDPSVKPKFKRKRRLPDVPVYPASLVLDALGQKCGCPNRIVV